LVLPLPIADLVHAAKADDGMARALIAKRNPVIVAAVAEAEARGRAHAILMVLSRRGLEPADDERARILAERDLGTLDRWLANAVTCASVSQLFG